MTDEQHYKLIEDFANNHSVAIGGRIKVAISSYSTSMNPVNENEGMKFEDINYLSDQISGASSFLFWLRRNDFVIRKAEKNGKSKRGVH